MASGLSKGMWAWPRWSQDLSGGVGWLPSPGAAKLGVWRAQASCLPTSWPRPPSPSTPGKGSQGGPHQLGRLPPGAHALLDLPPAAKGAA